MNRLPPLEFLMRSVPRPEGFSGKCLTNGLIAVLLVLSLFFIGHMVHYLGVVGGNKMHWGLTLVITVVILVLDGFMSNGVLVGLLFLFYLITLGSEQLRQHYPDAEFIILDSSGDNLRKVY